MRNIKIIVLLLCAFVVTALICGCSGDNEKRGNHSTSVTYDETDGDVYEQFDLTWLD